jgi:predicted transcriptional regulator
MADQAISVLLDGELARRTRDVAKGDRRSQSAVVASALNLYTALSPTARQVLEEVSGRAEMDEVSDAIERALLRIQWNRMAEQVDPVLTERLTGFSDEDLMSLASEAVDETRRDRARRG